MILALFLILFLVIVALIIVFTINTRNKRLSQLNISNWMDMSKEERRAFDYKRNRMSMTKKRSLLKEIRKEYKKVKAAKK